VNIQAAKMKISPKEGSLELILVLND
jgi:hypothetical protein